jgi:mRNA interferase MazF
MILSRPIQWQVVLANLEPIRGSEQAGVRPVLIVSHESINVSLSTLCVLLLTTHHQGSYLYPSEVLLPAGSAGQPNDTIVMAHQARTISKDRILRSYGSLTDPELRDQVREALRVYLDLH